jgi:hypothetical protein
MPHDPLDLLDGYLSREGHALVPKDHVEKGFALGQWVAKRRLAYQQGRSDPERSSRLEQLPVYEPPRAIHRALVLSR